MRVRRKALGDGVEGPRAFVRERRRENKWVEVIYNTERLGPGVPTSRLGEMLKAGVGTELAFNLETALNISFDQETTARMNKAAREQVVIF